MTFFSAINVDPHASEKTKNDGYDDHYDVDGKQCTIKRPNKIKQSAHQRNLARDSTSIPRGEPETKKERGKLERNTQIQVVRDQGHKTSSSGGMVASSGRGRPPLSSKYKGSRDSVQPDLNRNQTKPDSFPLPNVSKLEYVVNPLSTEDPLLFEHNFFLC